MTIPGDHLDDDALSTVVDDQLTPPERASAQAHLSACAECQVRLDEFRSVVTLLHALPEVDPPRDFSLGARLVRKADPPNVIRLRRWYTATRIAAASLAAVFAFLSAGALYVDSRPVPSAAVATVAQAPAAAAGVSAPTAIAVRVAAPAPARAPINPQADDQVAAATSISALPTPVPTPKVVPVSAPAIGTSDPGAPWRTAAIGFGLLAVLTLFVALLVRHRLRRALPQL